MDDRAAMDDGDVNDPLRKSPAETAAFFMRERARWRKLIEAAGVKPQ